MDIGSILFWAAVVGLALYVEFTFAPPYWLHAVLWVPLVVVLALAMLRPMKGWLIAQQYRQHAGPGRVDVDWITAAREVRERKFGAGSPADYKERARQSRFLQYRGFTGEQIARTFKRNDDEQD